MTVARRAGTTSVATLFAVALTVVATNWMAPSWARSKGLDMWSVSSLHSEMEADAVRDRVLTQEIAESRSRMEVKENLVENLLQGKTTLKEVVNEFLVLNRNHPACMTAISITYSGHTEEQKVAWNVIDFALRRANGQWIKKLVILTQLGKQYDLEFGKTTANR